MISSRIECANRALTKRPDSQTRAKHRLPLRAPRFAGSLPNPARWLRRAKTPGENHQKAFA
jgi:hypothetical protein